MDHLRLSAAWQAGAFIPCDGPGCFAKSYLETNVALRISRVLSTREQFLHPGDGSIPWRQVGKSRSRASTAYNGIYVELQTEALLKAG